LINTDPSQSSTPRFLLRPNSISSFDNEVEISGGEFLRLSSSRNFLYDCILFEERRKQIALALKEFELFLLSSAVERENSNLPRYEFFQDLVLQANLRSIGFLSSVKSMHDQFPKFSSVKSSIDVRQIFKEEWKSSTKNSCSFHFCWVFRNIAQHHKSPVNSVTLGGGWDSSREFRDGSLSVYARTRDMEGVREVKKEELERFLSDLGELVDIALIFRETAHEISRINEIIREKLKILLAENLSMYASFLDKVAYKDSGIRYVRAEKLLGGKIDQEFIISDSLIQRAIRLNGERLAKFQHQYYTTNRPRGHQK
jgi:hypothetical protein